jgi:tetratricopeptide (TPR) repeat protein
MEMPTLTREQRKALREFLVDRFSKDELYTLSFDLDINVERLPHDTTDAFVMALIQRCQNDKRLPALIELALEIREDEAISQILFDLKGVKAPAKQPPQAQENLHFANTKTRLEALIQKAYNTSFRQGRLHNFVGRNTELAEIKALITAKQNEGGYLTITGQAGQGKSCIIAKLVEEYGPDQIAHHFIPFTPPPQYQIDILSSLIATLLLKHNLLDLADAYIPSNATLPTLRNTFSELLWKLATLNQPELIFIDGLDQIKPDTTSGERDLAFLPSDLPAGIVVVIGTRPDDTLKPLELRHELNQYSLPALSLPDFKTLLASQPSLKLSAFQVDELYNALHGNAFDLGFVANLLQEAAVKDVDGIIEQVKRNPKHIFDITIDNWRKRPEWRTSLKPILGCLLVSTKGQALTAEELGEITQLDTEQVGAALLILGGVVGVLDQRGHAVYYLYHLKLIEYLQDNTLPPAKHVFSPTEIAALHLKMVQWCEKGGLANIWQDVKGASKFAEQRRRDYARQHYITHLYHAQAYEQLWQVLDEGHYGRAKVHYDPSMRSYAQDLNLGRIAATRDDLDFEESLQLLPKLWRYTLLRCSLASRADNYPESLFEAMVLLNQEQEALGLVELLTNPLKKIKILCGIVKILNELPDHKATAHELLIRAYQLANQIDQSDKRAKLDALKELIEATNIKDDSDSWVTQLVLIALTIKDSSSQVTALCEIAQAQVQVGQFEGVEVTLGQALQAANSIKDDFFKALSLCEIVITQAQTEQNEAGLITLEQALQTANSIEDNDFKASALKYITVAQVKLGQIELGAKILGQILQANGSLAHSSSLLSQIVTYQIQVAQFENAIVVINAIKDNADRASVLAELAVAQAATGQLEVATATLTQALQLTHSNNNNSANDGALMKIAEAQAQLDQFDAALLTAKSIEDTYFRAITLRNLAMVHAQMEQFAIAISISNSIEESTYRISALSNIATTQFRVGQIEASKSTLEQVLDFANSLENIDDKTEVLSKLAITQAQLGQAKAARTTLTQVLQVANSVEHKNITTKTLSEIAQAQIQANQVAAGTATLTQALHLASSDKANIDKANLLYTIAMLQMQLSQDEAAKVTIAQALQAVNSDQYSNPRASVSTVVQLALAQAVMGQVEASASSLTLALQITSSMEKNKAMVGALCEIVKAQVQTGQLELVESTLVQVLEVANSIDDSFARADVLSKIAVTQYKIELSKEAEDTLAEILQLITSQENDITDVIALSNIAVALFEVKLFDLSIATLQQALEVANSYKLSVDREVALGAIAIAQVRTGQIEAALNTIKDIEGSIYEGKALSEIAIAQAQAGQIEAAEISLKAIEERPLRVHVLEVIGTMLTQSKDFEQILSLIHKEWLQALTRDEALELLPLATGLFRLNEQLGVELYESFAWVDNFLRDCV